jgi:CHAT domain-containing protein/Tfp pilus assembly protein PilF
MKTLCNVLVDIYFYNNDINSALNTAKEDSAVSKEVYGEFSQEYCGTLNNLGIIYYYIMGNFQDAKTVLNEAKKIQETMPHTTDSAYAFTLNNLALVSEVLGEFLKAEPLYETAIKLVSKSIGEDNDTYALMVHNLAALYKLMGKYDKSDTLFKKSLALNKKINGERHPDIANEYNNIGDLYKLIGKYSEAEPLYKMAIKIRKEIFGDHHPEYAKSLSNLALLYHTMGRYQSAETLFKEAIEIQKEQRGADHPDYAGSVNNLALLFETMGKYNEAEPLYKNVLEIYKNKFGENHSFYAATLGNLAKLYMKMGLFEDSEKLFIKAKEIRKNTLGEKHPTYAKTLFNLAELYKFKKKYNESERLYKKALDLRVEKLGQDHPDCALSMAGLASLYKKMGELEKAEPYYLAALDKYLNQVKRYFPYLSEREKLEYWISVKKTFEDFNSYASVYYKSNPNIVNNLFNNTLVTKGLILSSTKKVLRNIRKSRDTSVIKLLDEWQNAKDNWLWLTQNPDQAKIQGIDIDSVAEYANELEKQISSRSEDFKKAFATKEITWQDIRNNLKKGEAAVEIIRFKKNDSAFKKNSEHIIYYAALIIKPNSTENPEIVILHNGNDLESKYVRLYGNLVKIQKIQIFKTKTSLENDLIKKEQFDLFNQYWAKIQKKLHGINKVYLSVDGVYNSINLQTLRNPATEKYILEELDLRLLTNTKDILNYRTEPDVVTKNSAELFGDPLYNLNPSIKGIIARLPGTKVEVQKIAGTMIEKNWTINKYLGEKATEENIKKVNNPEILHIATHGMFEQDVESDDYDMNDSKNKKIENPLLRSKLFFAGVENNLDDNPGTNDGKLTAYEAMDLNLDNTEIVVMSACETGLGEIKNGEGVYGLQRAFQVAGAKSLIMSLWTVNDQATQQLMISFYQKVLSGMEKRTAFRETQLELKKEYPEFYYWGAFVMVGE